MLKKLLGSIVLALCIWMSPIPIQAQENSGNVTIYHTNDMHGYVTESENVIGLAKIAALKASNDHSILVDAGDATQGLPIASLSKGADIIRLMNVAGYDVMVAGNHEFDFGIDVLKQNVAAANFPILGANVYYNGSPLLQDQTIIEKAGYRIGFFGISTTQTASSTNPEGMQGVTFASEIETATAQVQSLEAQDVDAIIAIVHCGNGDAPVTSQMIAQEVDGIDVIIDGHSHTQENETIGDTLIVQTGSNGSAVGQLELTFDGKNLMAKETLKTAADLVDVKPLAAVENEIASINASQQELLATPVAESNTTLRAGLVEQVALTRVVETNLGDLVADAFRIKGEEFVKETMPVVAVENGGGIREKMPNGIITRNDLMTAFPFSNTLYMKVVTPNTLYAMMEQSVVEMDGQDPKTGLLLQQNNSGGFLQISGFNVVLDPDSDTVQSITLSNESTPLDRNDTSREILLVGNNYIMSGGNDYSMLASLPKYGEAGGELETIEAYMQNADLSQYIRPQGRIQYTGGSYQPKDYEATIQVLNTKGTPFANQSVDLVVDGTQKMSVKTDENGFAKLTVSDGAHNVRLQENNTEIYIDNYAGFGLIEDQFRGSFPVLTTTKELSDQQDPTQPEEDKPQEEQKPSEKPEKEDSKTNDDTGTSTETNMTLWIGILAVSAVVLIIIGILLKKKK